MLRRLWILVAIAWLIGGAFWVVASDWGYVEYRREDAERREAIAAYSVNGQTYAEWQKECRSKPPEPQTGYFPPPERDCNTLWAMQPRSQWDQLKHDVSLLAPIIYTHYRKPLLWTVLAPIVISTPLLLWLIPGLVRWVRYGTKAATKPPSRNPDVSATITRGRRP